jgi:histidyl-tRNA synthetase
LAETGLDFDYFKQSLLMEKPSIPNGMRDFSPSKMYKRSLIIDTIREVFKLHGFQPLETPTMEKLSVLTGKYGDEGDQLIFKVLNSGDFLDKVQTEGKDYKKLTPEIAEKALRYDLTVPFARFVAMNRNELQFPFKRFQIQPVWRADRPQRGRYREFYQCDADVVGTDSLLCEQELMEMAHKVLYKLDINQFAIKYNNRKILSGIAEAIGEHGKEAIICTAIDKLDKIGQEGVEKELLGKGISTNAIDKLMPILEIAGDNQQKINRLGVALTGSEIGQKGLDELQKVIELLAITLPEHKVVFDPALARGLSYYTGAIFEIKALGVQMGSISGGGRYDNLTGVFGLPNMSGVGISFGIDRIYDVMEELGLFPMTETFGTRVMVVAMEEAATSLALEIAKSLREAKIATEIYPEIGAKMKKQLGYVNERAIPYAIILGSEEVQTKILTIKNMATGVQEKLAAVELASYFK